MFRFYVLTCNYVMIPLIYLSRKSTACAASLTPMVCLGQNSLKLALHLQGGLNLVS